MSVPAGEVLGLAMAVRAQEFEVLETVVIAITVDVVKGEGHGLAAPVAYSTDLTTRLLEPLAQQPHLQVRAAAVDPGSEEVLCGHLGRAGCHRSPRYGTAPSLA